MLRAEEPDALAGVFVLRGGGGPSCMFGAAGSSSPGDLSELCSPRFGSRAAFYHFNHFAFDAPSVYVRAQRLWVFGADLKMGLHSR